MGLFTALRLTKIQIAESRRPDVNCGDCLISHESDVFQCGYIHFRQTHMGYGDTV